MQLNSTDTGLRQGLSPTILCCLFIGEGKSNSKLEMVESHGDLKNGRNFRRQLGRGKENKPFAVRMFGRRASGTPVAWFFLTGIIRDTSRNLEIKYRWLTFKSQKNFLDFHRVDNKFVTRLKNGLEPRKTGQKESPRKYKNKTVSLGRSWYNRVVPAANLMSVSHWTTKPACILSK